MESKVVEFSDYTCAIRMEKYLSGANSIILVDVVDNFPVANCCVNLPGLADDEVAIKNYSENEGILDALLEAKVISEPVRFERSGFVNIPICKLI